ncbi:unnamed protein product [Linum tenue]|uniref:Uncharacterized protein n=1 Tax=Linum tenue TaxID=586396 RepID=A0AAV0HKG4_9ROSI|nr:unnamed protein product [Linum tenue]
MQKDKKSNCSSTSHRQLKDNVKHRLNDLQERFSNLQAARREGRQRDVVVLEEQVSQSLREWNAEVEAPSPASSLLAGDLGSFSDELNRYLQLYEEEDDATSPLTQFAVLDPQHGIQQNTESLPLGDLTAYHGSFGNADTLKQDFEGLDQPSGFSDEFESIMVKTPDMNTFLEGDNFILDEALGHGLYIGNNTNDVCENSTECSKLSYVSPPPSAFMGPKCALWDCTRPAQGSEPYKDYCNSFHGELAVSEGCPGTRPILRPKGIGVKDNFLFDALTARIQGNDVGIPQCEGAANAKSPWNATELFDLSLCEGETVREWLFFDKPRRAYDSGSRKQRSLPDYSGRWHESRKQDMTLGCQKRSYYMDPQPSCSEEWHLYEYQVKNSDASCALYKLEFKLVEGKKTPKGKVSKDSLTDLQIGMERLTAHGTPNSSVKSTATADSRKTESSRDSPLQQSGK